jgi:ketosteroid isomerase-like protein
MKTLLPLTLALMFAMALTGCAAKTESAAPPPPRAVVEAVFAAFNRHDAEAMAAPYAPDAVLTSSDRCAPLQGRDAVRRIHAELFAAAPDIKDELKEVIAEGDRVAVRFVSSSAVPGAAFEIEIADFFEVKNGLIVRDMTIFDNGGAPCRN